MTGIVCAVRGGPDSRPTFTPEEFEAFALELERVAHPLLVGVPPPEQ